jgi:hypothetical protein
LAGEVRKLFPDSWILREGKAAGAWQRQRKVSIVALFWTVVLGFAGSKKRTLAELRRELERRTGRALQESSFYEHFHEGLSRLLLRAVLYALEAQQDVSKGTAGALSFFQEVLAVDSMVIRLHVLLQGDYPGTRINHSPAAAKLHMVMNVLRAGPRSVRLSSGRTDDSSPWQRLGPWVRGRLLLMDLGYFAYGLFARIDQNGGFYISRLKSGANPLIVRNNRACRGRAIKLEGRRLRDVLPHLERTRIDVMVEVQFERRAYRGRSRRDRAIVRLVGVYNEETERYHLYLTNIATDKLDAEQIAEVYRLRWQVELLFKELQTHYRIEQLPSAKREVVESLVYAAILTLIISRRLLAALRRRLPEGRSIPPLLWAAVFSGIASDVLGALLRNLPHLAPPQNVWDLLMSQAMDPHLGRPTAPVRMTQA